MLGKCVSAGNDCTIENVPQYLVSFKLQYGAE